MAGVRLHAVTALMFVLGSWAIARLSAPDASPAHARAATPPHVHRDRRVTPDTSRKHAAPSEAADATRATTTFDVTFLHVHTRELLPVVGDVRAARLSRFLRCRATGAERPMATRPFTIARLMATRFGAHRIDVLSGYRSDKFNETLRKKGHQVAAHSRHVRGEALDFRLDGVEPRDLARAVGQIHEGGVGIYESGFVHVDVGPARRWRGL